MSTDLPVPFELPPVDADDEMVVEWIRQALIVLDDRPRISTWRHRAVGQDVATVIAETTTRTARLNIDIPIGEWRVIRHAAERRGMPLRTFVKALLYTTLAVTDGATAEDVPTLARGGIIRP